MGENDEHGKKIYKTIFDLSEITSQLIDRNVQHFGQAKETPLATGQFAEDIGISATNDFADEILNGTADFSKYNLSPETTLMLETLKFDPAKPIAEISDKITLAEVKRGLTKWSEKTTTSPSGRHLGHYKILLQPDKPEEKLEITFNAEDDDRSHNSEDADLNGSDSDEEEEVDKYAKGDKILQVHTDVINLSIQLEHALKRWLTSITLMLEKDPGDPKIDRLRVIHILEADWNLILKLIWAKQFAASSIENTRENPRRK